MARIGALPSSVFDALLQLVLLGLIGWTIFYRPVPWWLLFLTGAVLTLLAWRAIRNLSPLDVRPQEEKKNDYGKYGPHHRR